MANWAKMFQPDRDALSSRLLELHLVSNHLILGANGAVRKVSHFRELQRIAGVSYRFEALIYGEAQVLLNNVLPGARPR